MHEDHTILKNHIHNENPKKTQEYLFANQFFRIKFESILKIQAFEFYDPSFWLDRCLRKQNPNKTLSNGIMATLLIPNLSNRSKSERNKSPWAISVPNWAQFGPRSRNLSPGPGRPRNLGSIFLGQCPGTWAQFGPGPWLI